MGFFDSFTSRIEAMRVTLHNPVAYPGSVVTGVMTFTAMSAVPMRGLRIQLLGRERTTIVETHSSTAADGNSTSSSTTYIGNNLFLNQVFAVSGDCIGRPSGQEHELPPGKYAIPFEFCIPFGLPPTANRCGCSYYVQYEVNGFVERRSGATDGTSATAALRVVTTMPIGQYTARSAGGMARLRTADVSCCCCFSRGRLTFNVQTDKNIIALDRDDPIAVTVTVDASSSTAGVKAVVLSLQNIVPFTAEGNSSCQTRTIREHRQALDVPAGSPIMSVVMSLPNQPLPRALGVDDVLPSMRGSLFHSKWSIVVEIEMSWASDVTVAIPIVAVPRVDETNQAPIMQWDTLTYPVLKSGQGQEYVYSLPPRLREMAHGLSQLPPVTGQAAPAPYAQRSEHPPPSIGVVLTSAQ